MLYMYMYMCHSDTRVMYERKSFYFPYIVCINSDLTCILLSVCPPQAVIECSQVMCARTWAGGVHGIRGFPICSL